MSSAAIPDRFEELERQMAGRLVRPDADGYDAARAIHNAMIDRRPAIARCTGTADVLAAVNFARRHSLAATVRGGGHSAAGHCIADDALLIDLSAMKGVHVDSVQRTARPAPGVLLGIRPRDAGLWAGHHDGDRARHRGERSGAGRRSGLAFAPVRARLRHIVGADVVTADGACCGRARRRMRTCSGDCAAAAAISAWLRRSSSACIRLQHRHRRTVGASAAESADVYRFHLTPCARRRMNLRRTWPC